MFVYRKTFIIFIAILAQLVSIEPTYSASVLAANESKERLTLRSHLKANVINDYKPYLIEKLKKITFFSASFEQKIIDDKGNVLQEGRGELAVRKPNMVHWDTQTPDESLLVSDGETLWVYDPFIEQATAYKLASSIANTPILLLTSDANELWEHYSVSKINQSTYLIHANDVNSQIKTLELQFYQDKLSGFTFLDATGQLSVIRLKDADFTTSPTLDLFQFDLPEGTYLDDQR